jgi:hemoglobin
MTIYEEIGGEVAIDALVEVFYRIVLADSRINEFFTNVDMNKQKRMQKSFMNHVFGEKPYRGRSMRVAHANLNLKDEHFNAVADDLIQAMKELNLTQSQIDQVMAVVATTRSDVLGLPQ